MVFVDFNTCFTDPKQFIRLVVLSSCICVTFYQLEQCMKKLLHPPITTSNKLYLNQSIKYPAITFCKKPGFKTNLFPKYGLKKRSELSNRGAFRNFDFSNYTLNDFMIETTYSVEETVLIYGLGSIVMNTEMFSTSNFFLTLGNCHTFQTKKLSSEFSLEGGMFFYLEHIQEAGKAYWNRVEHIRKSFGVVNGSLKINTGSEAGGMNVFIHDSSESITDQAIQSETYSQFIFIESGESVYLTIDAKEFRMVNHPDEQCQTEENYSQSRCYESCMHDTLTGIYGCSLPWMKGDIAYPFCNNSEVIDRITSVLNDFSERKNYMDDCLCPKPCHIYFYLPKVVQRKDNQGDYNSLLSLYYTSNIVTVVKQVISYDWCSFVSDLGGSFGLFLGLSVIGFIEVIEGAFRLLARKRHQKLDVQERAASLRDQKMVWKIIEYFQRNRKDVASRTFQMNKY